MKNAYWFTLLISFSFLGFLGLFSLKSGAASKPIDPSEESGSCLQTVFVNTGQTLGNTNSLSVALGDLDGDELADAVIGSAAGSGVWDEVWFNQGGGTFSMGPTFGENGDTPGVVLVDAEGDGDLDIIPAGAGSQVFKNDGNGNFTIGQGLNSGFNSAIAVGDLNGSGRLEVVLAGDGATTPPQVWWNTGDLSNPFVAGPTFPISHTVEVLIGNVDGDADNDLVLVNDDFSGYGSAQVWLNNNDGTFSLGDTIIPITINPGAATLGDVNGVNGVDLIIGFKGSLPGPMERWTNDGAGNFNIVWPIDFPGRRDDLLLADLDNDTDLDLLGSASPGYAFAMLNNGLGTFCLAQANIGANVNRLAVGFLDGDTDLDLFLATNGANEVWLNELNPTSPTVDLSVQVDGNQNVTPGTMLSYSATVTNQGTFSVTNVTVEMDIFFAGNFAWDGANPGTCDNATRTCVLESLNGLESVTLVATGTVYDLIFYYEYGWSYVIASVTSSGVDVNLDNNDDTLDVFLTNCDCVLCDLWLNQLPLQNLSIPTQSLFRLGTSIDLFLYFQLRDEILFATPAGQNYTDLYYTHDAELSNLIFSNPAIFDAAVDTLMLWQPNLQALVDREGETALITQAQVDAVDDFLTQLSAVASPALQADIAIERANLPAPDDFVGMTIEEARGIVVGYGIFLPTVLGQP